MNVITNPNSTSINFYCPNHLKTNFDELVKFKRVSRTSIINSLIEKWMRDEFQQMKEDGEMNRLIREIKVRNHKNNPPQPSKPQKTGWFSSKSNDDYEPPMIPTIRDDLHNDDWDDPSGVNRLFEELK